MGRRKARAEATDRPHLAEEQCTNRVSPRLIRLLSVPEGQTDNMQTKVTSQASPGSGTDLVSLLSWALRPIRHDRWLVAALRDRRLRTVAQSQPDPDNPYRQLRELQPPAWRCLLSAQATCVTRCGVSAGASAGPREWELDSPAILYAPVGLPGQRAEGLLILANLRPHTYGTCDVRYVSLLAHGLLRWVASAAGSQSALHELLAGRAPSRAATLLADWLEEPPSPDLPDRLRRVELSHRALSLRRPVGGGRIGADTTARALQPGGGGQNGAMLVRVPAAADCPSSTGSAIP